MNDSDIEFIAEEEIKQLEHTVSSQDTSLTTPEANLPWLHQRLIFT